MGQSMAWDDEKRYDGGWDGGGGMKKELFEAWYQISFILKMRLQMSCHVMFSA